jgi:hypothetical protein
MIRGDDLGESVDRIDFRRPALHRDRERIGSPSIAP